MIKSQDQISLAKKIFVSSNKKIAIIQQASVKLFKRKVKDIA